MTRGWGWEINVDIVINMIRRRVSIDYCGGFDVHVDRVIAAHKSAIATVINLKGYDAALAFVLAQQAELSRAGGPQ